MTELELRKDVERCRVQVERAHRIGWMFRHDVRELADLDLWCAQEALVEFLARQKEGK